MAQKCIFCQIAAGEVPSDIVYQDKEFLAFKDISPQAPVHLLIIPKLHITSLVDLAEVEERLIGRLVMVAKKLAAQEGIAKKGYRLVVNCGPQGGQQVPHLHLHLIGGRKLADKLG